VTTVQTTDIFSAFAIDGFDRIMFGGAVLLALAACRPEVTGYLRRSASMPSPDEIRLRPLSRRTTLVSMSGGLLAAAVLTALVPHSAFALIFAIWFLGAAAAASIWSALVLAPLAGDLPDGEQSGAPGAMLRRMGRSPWHGALKLSMWGAAFGAIVGAVIVVYRAVRMGNATNALPLVELCAVVGVGTGYVGSLASWAGSVGEYAKTGVMAPDPWGIWTRSPDDSRGSFGSRFVSGFRSRK
jgi:hypothetical protein